MSYLNNRIRAFGFAFSGLVQAFGSETHLKLQGLAALFVIVLASGLSVSVTEWILLLGCISLVVCLELVNSALERLCNLVSPERRPEVKYIKDVAAAAVLIACVFAAIAGVLVFWPYVFRLF